MTSMLGNKYHRFTEVFHYSLFNPVRYKDCLQLQFPCLEYFFWHLCAVTLAFQSVKADALCLFHLNV